MRTNRADRLILRTATHLTASIAPPLDPRPVWPLSIKSTYFGKTSIKGEKNPLPEIDGHPSLQRHNPVAYVDAGEALEVLSQAT